MRSLALAIALLALAACASSPVATQRQSAALIGHEGDGSPLTTCNR
jgi:hypothetical protein